MSRIILRNRAGMEVDGYPVLRKKDYGTGEFQNGDIRRPIPDYQKWSLNADEDGFDITFSDIFGCYKMEITLPKGTELIRYGSTKGRFTAPKGTKFEQLSLPWDEQSCEYHEYIVIADSITVMCIVTKGRIAPAFECMGGGIQYLHQGSIERNLVSGKLEEVLYG